MHKHGSVVSFPIVLLSKRYPNWFLCLQIKNCCSGHHQPSIEYDRGPRLSWTFYQNEVQVPWQISTVAFCSN